MNTTSTWEWCSTQRDVGGLLSYGDLIAAGEYRLHSRFRRAVNFVRDEELVSIVDESVGAGPLNIVLDSVADVNADGLLVGDDAIRLGPERLERAGACRYESALALPSDIHPAVWERGLLLLAGALRASAPRHSLVHLFGEHEFVGARSGFESEFASRFADGCRMLCERRWADGARAIAGIGYGLTPSGDDFLCGLLIALYVRRRALGEDTADAAEIVSVAAHSENLFSLSFLRCAEQGRVSEKMKRVVGAVVLGREAQIVAAARDLVSVGETSGADTAAGLIFGLVSCCVEA